MKSLDEKKWELRSKVLSQRMNISEADWKEKSEKIREHFMKSDFYHNARFIHCFVSMNQRREVDTKNLISRMLEEGKKVAVPVTNFLDTSLSHTEIGTVEGMKPNKWGVPEPEMKNEINIDQLDVVVVPMAAADKKGNRLGYGKGFYDRFLSKTKALKVGFIFYDFIYDEMPAESFDIKMDVLISERGLFYTQQ